jgi:hypothetical protein
VIDAVDVAFDRLRAAPTRDRMLEGTGSSPRLDTGSNVVRWMRHLRSHMDEIGQSHMDETPQAPEEACGRLSWRDLPITSDPDAEVQSAPGP